MAAVLLSVYALTLTGLIFFAAHRLKILWLYARYCRGETPAPPAWEGRLPLVCVQCPVYNEPLVIAGLLDCVTALRWPGDRIEIQVLDDSTDHTPAVIEEWLAAHPERARCCRHLRRVDRAGYKAGALTAGIQQSDASFFAVFDADFRPAPDFLEVLIPHFADPRVAVVQARWDFANRGSSLLTRFQAVFLDAHFVVEQAARHASGLFFNFNGTAGIWRRSALEDAGGWTDDTVTEDLDISYRVQLRGWRLVYRDDYPVPSELPESLTAFKSQQRRWTKGGVQVARKLIRRVLASRASARVKREAVSHLITGLVHPLLMLFVALLVPCLLIIETHPSRLWWLVNPVTFILLGATTMAFYVTGQYFRRREWLGGLVCLAAAPVVMAFGLAMSVSGCLAVFEGMLTNGGEFVRTPKGGARAAGVDGGLAKIGSRTLFTTVLFGEVALGACMLAGAAYFQREGMLLIAMILLVKGIGFLGVAAISTYDLLPGLPAPGPGPDRGNACRGRWLPQVEKPKPI
ncbi:MAG TPA: glycosyltransferase family 2 protein [Opitutaceae bacterium]|jgi:cellulose synthase/poly-beta-1,6-N-acetylglucosamine synthase-like glycosyltransferase|nr:glycosyltransferase family 2 protein [Opitutaceae bacterium]